MGTPKPWSVLHGDDGHTIVVTPEATPLEALRELLWSYHGEEITDDNPVILAAAEQLKVETWRSCTKAWREAEAVVDDPDADWWAPDGDGRRSVLVVHYDGDIYTLGDEAVEADSRARTTTVEHVPIGPNRADG